MKASRVYRLIHTRAGRGPAFLADPSSIDHIEVVDVDDGEVVLFWDLPPRDATRLARRLREDMGRLGAEDFLATWGDVSDEPG